MADSDNLICISGMGIAPCKCERCNAAHLRAELKIPEPAAKRRKQDTQDKTPAEIGGRFVLTMRSGVSSMNDIEYGHFQREDMAQAVGHLLLEADANNHPEWTGFDVVQMPNPKPIAWISRLDIVNISLRGGARVGEKYMPGDFPLYLDPTIASSLSPEPKCPGNYGHADGCKSASKSHPYSEVLSCCKGRNIFPAYAGEGYIVVKEHVWEHDDGGRPTLAYLWPSEFNRQVFFTFEQAHEFINAEPGLPLGWVAMKIQFPKGPRE